MLIGVTEAALVVDVVETTFRDELVIVVVDVVGEVRDLVLVASRDTEYVDSDVDFEEDFEVDFDEGFDQVELEMDDLAGVVVEVTVTVLVKL